ncbi:hypothetical protein PCANC_00279 [Puccinia coronata f. sp. avenae]|uniref:PH domain-containing protein n=1 Tax=Puccinia coronata f. sp. avenae TaxID=200324 RepID=A0A2N5W9B0_9BASI|nr:hypothetical protein PCANC_00279 [Puccinia coronata f. sp. avenae]
MAAEPLSSHHTSSFKGKAWAADHPPEDPAAASSENHHAAADHQPTTSSSTITAKHLTPAHLLLLGPHPRYFDSAEAWGHKLVIFGGMRYAASTPSPATQQPAPNALSLPPPPKQHQPTKSELGLPTNCLTCQTGYKRRVKEPDQVSNDYIEIVGLTIQPIKILKPNRCKRRNLLRATTGGGGLAGTSATSSAGPPATPAQEDHHFIIITSERNYLLNAPTKNNEICWISAIQCLHESYRANLPRNFDGILDRPINT